LAQSRGGLGASRAAVAKKVGESAHAAALLARAERAERHAAAGDAEGGGGAGDAEGEASECPVCLEPLDDPVRTQRPPRPAVRRENPAELSLAGGATRSRRSARTRFAASAS